MGNVPHLFFSQEERQKKLQAENEEMWRLVNMALNNQMRNLTVSASPVTRQQQEEKRKEEEVRRREGKRRS